MVIGIKGKAMLSYLKSIGEMKANGHNTNQSTIRIPTKGKRYETWRKCFMNGDEVGFFVKARG